MPAAKTLQMWSSSPFTPATTMWCGCMTHRSITLKHLICSCFSITHRIVQNLSCAMKTWNGSTYISKNLSNIGKSFYARMMRFFRRNCTQRNCSLSTFKNIYFYFAKNCNANAATVYAHSEIICSCNLLFLWMAPSTQWKIPQTQNFKFHINASCSLVKREECDWLPDTVGGRRCKGERGRFQWTNCKQTHRDLNEECICVHAYTYICVCVDNLKTPEHNFPTND